MKQNNVIGGYFELELSQSGKEFHDGTVSLNSARAAFEYILRVRKPRLVYLPKFTCEVMLEPLKKLEINHQFYPLDSKLELENEIDVASDELLVYTNYFGCKDDYSRQLADKFGEKIVIDCSQAFYYKRHKKEHIIYSPRKFFGVADGGYAVTDQYLDDNIPAGLSYQRMSHLLMCADIGAEAGYGDFKINDASLIDEPMTLMSQLTKKILKSVNYEAAQSIRKENFAYLHKTLGSANLLSIENSIDGPMVYPLLAKDASDLKKKLIENKIFVATYWPNVFEWCSDNDTEYKLAKNIIALPIDQRYSIDDMQRILEVMNYGN